MNRLFLLAGALLLSACAASATTTQKWKAGYDNSNEPLNYTKSNVKWSVNTTTRKLTVTYTLVGATPGKVYQVDLTPYCTTFPSTFGQFPVQGLGGGNTCPTVTRQGVTASLAFVEVGVVLTDINGNGTFSVVISPVASGTYNVQFRALDGAGADLTGGAGNDGCGGDDENDDFQSPGPFGTTTTITIP
jgi:hypothetical protein